MVLGRWGLVRVDKITNLYGFALSVTDVFNKPLKTNSIYDCHYSGVIKDKGMEVIGKQADNASQI